MPYPCTSQKCFAPGLSTDEYVQQQLGVLWNWLVSFTNVFENGFVAPEASRTSCELIVYASESCVRALSDACYFILQFVILRHEIARNFHPTENIRSEVVFLTMHFLLRFKHFSGSGKLFKNFQRLFNDFKLTTIYCKCSDIFFIQSVTCIK